MKGKVTNATAPRKKNAVFRMSTAAAKMQEPRDVKCQTCTDSLCRVKFVQKGKILKWQRHLVTGFNSKEVLIANTQVWYKWMWTYRPSIWPVPWLLTCPDTAPGPGQHGHREKSSSRHLKGCTAEGEQSSLPPLPAREERLGAVQEPRRPPQSFHVMEMLTFPPRSSHCCCPRYIQRSKSQASIP